MFFHASHKSCPATEFICTDGLGERDEDEQVLHIGSRPGSGKPAIFPSCFVKFLLMNSTFYHPSCLESTVRLFCPKLILLFKSRSLIPSDSFGRKASFGQTPLWSPEEFAFLFGLDFSFLAFPRHLRLYYLSSA